MGSIVDEYRDLFFSIMGRIDRQDPLPVPWFAYNFWDKLQWSAYVGDCDGPRGLAFGINIEFTQTWKKIRPRLTEEALYSKLENLGNDEWHWHGRPGFLCKNPGIVDLYPRPFPRVSQVDITKWLGDLDAILDGQMTWAGGTRPMRPQLQIMRRVGNYDFAEDMNTVQDNVRTAMKDMGRLMAYLSGRG